MSTTHADQPFENDVAYLTAEFAWVRLRSKRIAIQREAEEADDVPANTRTLGRAKKTASAEHERRLPAAREAEEEARKLIDQRLTATRNSGRVLGLDALCDEHHLSEFERRVLMLGTMVALGDRVAQNLDGSGSHGWWGGSLTPEVLFNFAGFSVRDRVTSRVAFGTTSPLLKHNLIVLHIGSTVTPADLPGACVEITTAAFARIVGTTDFGLAAQTSCTDVDGPF